MASIKRIAKDSLGVPIWEAVYRRTPGGKQIRRRFHVESKAEVQRTILMDSARSGVNQKWSEGLQAYNKGKTGLITAGSAENVERAVRVFIELMGDLPIEETTPAVFRSFMAQCSTPKVANHHRRALLSVANYLKKHSGSVSVVPFADVPPLPSKPKAREPVHSEQVGEYLDALPPHVRRPVLMVLLFGLCSTAVCGLSTDSHEGKYLRALDKGGGVRRLIPVDDTLAEILEGATAWRAETKAPGSALFVCEKGRPWTHDRLLRHAQKHWKKAGLERKVLHEIRHTLGTLAGRSFPARMVKAAMGHHSEASSLAYWHPDEEMAAEVRNKIITDLSPIKEIDGNLKDSKVRVIADKNGKTTCPCCNATLYISKANAVKSRNKATHQTAPAGVAERQTRKI